MKKEIQKTQKVSIMTVRKPYNKRECRMSSEAKNNAMVTGSGKDDAQAIDRRNVLLGASSLVAATALTSEALAQAQKAAPSAAPAAAPAAGSKPNILFIMGDDIGWFNVSAYNMGVMGYRTPNIDRIGREGAVFTDWYGQQSCTAGRAAFITGQTPIRTGLTKVGLPGAELGLGPLDPSVADVLKTYGYATGQFGKNHLGDRDEHLPTAHGFDEFFGNLYHLNAEEEPENPDYPKDPEFSKRFGPRQQAVVLLLQLDPDAHFHASEEGIGGQDRAWRLSRRHGRTRRNGRRAVEARGRPRRRQQHHCCLHDRQWR